MTWQLQDAKNKFSQVVEASLTEGPQIITRRGKSTAVLVSTSEYERLKHPKKSFKDLLMSTDLSELDLERDTSTTGRATPFSFDE